MQTFSAIRDNRQSGRTTQKIHFALIIAGFTLMLPIAALSETFYKWQDTSGTWVYGEHPPTGVEAVSVTTSTGRSKRSATSSTASTAADNADSDKAGETELFVEVAPKLSKKERKDLCSKATGNLDALTSSAVIRQRDADGNVSELSEEDRQKEIDKAQTAKEKYCN